MTTTITYLSCTYFTIAGDLYVSLSHGGLLGVAVKISLCSEEEGKVVNPQIEDPTKKNRG